jgi:hypothetical protein
MTPRRTPSRRRYLSRGWATSHDHGQGPRGECGASSLMSLLCALIMLMSVLVTTHVMVGLQRRSVAEAVALDVLTDTAQAGGPSRSVGTERLVRLLGSGTTVEWTDVGDDLMLRVQASPSSLIARGPLATLARIDIRVTSRREELVDP